MSIILLLLCSICPPSDGMAAIEDQNPFRPYRADLDVVWIEGQAVSARQLGGDWWAYLDGQDYVWTAAYEFWDCGIGIWRKYPPGE